MSEWDSEKNRPVGWVNPWPDPPSEVVMNAGYVRVAFEQGADAIVDAAKAEGTRQGFERARREIRNLIDSYDGELEDFMDGELLTWLCYTDPDFEKEVEKEMSDAEEEQPERSE